MNDNHLDLFEILNNVKMLLFGRVFNVSKSVTIQEYLKTSLILQKPHSHFLKRSLLIDLTNFCVFKLEMVSLCNPFENITYDFILNKKYNGSFFLTNTLMIKLFLLTNS